MRNLSLLSKFALTGLCALTLLRPGVVMADSPVLNQLFPELVNLLYAHDVLHARVFEEIEATNQSPSAAIGKRLLTEQLEELAEATASHYHSAGDHLAMLGPHRVFESRAVPGIIALVGLFKNKDYLNKVSLNSDSKILLFGCEGLTDAAMYEKLLDDGLKKI